MITVSPTIAPTAFPSSPTHIPTRGAVTYVTFQVIITLTGLTISSTTSQLYKNEIRFLTSNADTVSLLSYVMYYLLGLTSASTVNTMLVAHGAGNYVTTFNISIAAESLGYSANSVVALYSSCMSILTNSIASGSFISTIKLFAEDWGYSDFDTVSNVGTFTFFRNSTTYTYTNSPTITPMIGMFFILICFLPLLI